jgi:hypothetical protein
VTHEAATADGSSATFGGNLKIRQDVEEEHSQLLSLVRPYTRIIFLKKIIIHSVNGLPDLVKFNAAFTLLILYYI